jgi:septum formation protein
VTRLVLASASPARFSTLRNAGVEPAVVVSGVDEDAVVAAATAERGPLGPADVALVLACAKAEAVAEAGGATTAGDALILGCDSTLELDGEVHGKPADAAEATKRWHAMRGRSGVLHTGHWLIDRRASQPNRAVGSTSSTVVHFADLSDDEIDAYVATGEPLHVAGAFTIDGLGGPFVTGIEGDHHTVVGLSLPLLRDLMAALGISWPDLWAP